MKKIIFFLMIAAFASSCEQPEVGYISDNIHSLQDVITVPKGLFMLASTPAVEGSTYPMEWKITGITDKDGKPTNALQEEHEILTWLKPFDPTKDTTLELAMKKLEVSKRASILLNPTSGQLAFTQASRKVVGDDFDISVHVKNVRGERQLNNFTHIKMIPFVPAEIKNSMAVQLEGLTGTSWGKIGKSYDIANNFDTNTPSVFDGTSPYMTVVKVSDEPKLSIKVKHIVTDSKNQVIDPAKLVFNPTRLGNFHDNTIGGGEMDAVGTTFTLPAPPFPQYSRRFMSNDGSPGIYWMYYLTAPGTFSVDKAAVEADNPIPAGGWSDYWAKYTDTATGEILNRGYIRWAFKINDTGTWEVKCKIPYSIKK
jgi:hypothetical protein